ncbi:MAG TPA: copper resistance protein B [Allosphingosinicella sp.]|jgi:copper resistance protein B
MRLPASSALLLAALAPVPAAAQRLDYRLVEDDALAAPPRLGYSKVEGDTAPAGLKLQWGLLDRFEYAAQRSRDGYAWDFSALVGGDRHRLWLGTNGEGEAWGAPGYVELNALYSYRFARAWDANAGMRYDAQSGADRAYATVGAQYDDGEALWLGGWAYLSNKGELSARLAGYYNQKLAGALILQPSAELDYYGEDMPELGLGRGFGYAEAGLRLRYEVKEAFAPYVGLSWSRDLGRTARLTRAEGDDPETKSVVMGVRSSF